MSSSQHAILSREACPPAGPYSQAIVVTGSPTLRHIYVSGQIPADKTGTLVTGTIGELTTACCENMRAILRHANCDLKDVVKTTVFLDDMANFDAMNTVYATYFPHKPARSCVAVKQLPKGVPVEIEGIAISESSSK